jgi:hypothetical protein
LKVGAGVVVTSMKNDRPLVSGLYIPTTILSPVTIICNKRSGLYPKPILRSQQTYFLQSSCSPLRFLVTDLYKMSVSLIVNS